MEKMIFTKVFNIYGNGGHLGHVSWIIYIHFQPPILQIFPLNNFNSFPKSNA